MTSPLIIISILGYFSLPAFSGALPESGSKLPEFRLEVPTSEKDKSYLNIEDAQSFTIDQIDAKLLLLEIVGVYCPQCHIQNPLFNKLFYRIKKNPDMFKKVKIIAIAAGANDMEVEYFKEQYRIPFPVFKDPKFEIHKILGEPRTPYTMILVDDNSVVYTHLGIIEDIDKFFLKIKRLAQ